MNPKTLILIITILALSALGTSLSTFSTNNGQLHPSEDDLSTIKGQVKKAKATGVKEIIYPAPIGIKAEVRDLKDALKHFSVIVAEPVERISHLASPWAIVTWYKYRILERLSLKNIKGCVNCDSSDSIPDELLPVNPDEILIPQIGGTVIIDGVKVTQAAEFSKEFTRAFEIKTINQDVSHEAIVNSRQYLLFVSPISSQNISKMPIGPSGAFVITGTGQLEPVDKRPHVLSSEMQRLSIQSLQSFKERIRNQANLQ